MIEIISNYKSVMINYIRKFIWDISSRTRTFKGKMRLVRLISRPSGLNLIKVKRDGVFWLLQGHDLNEFAVATRSNHSPLISKSLCNEIKENNVKIFWDIGANIGAISLPLLKKIKNLEAILFEPSAEVAGRLIRNFSENSSLLKRARIMNIALSDSEGVKNFFVSNEDFNSGVGGLGLSNNRFQFAVAIQAYTGDNLIKSGICPIPDLIKIDVEGFEFEVLKGLKETLIKSHPSIVFEHSIYRLKERDFAHDKVTKFLESLGYVIYHLSDKRRVKSADLDKDNDFIAKVDYSR